MTKNIIKLNDIKAANTLALLNLLLQKKEISRVELAAELACDNTTVTRAVRDLTSRNLICSAGKKEFPRGRPREMLTLNTGDHCLLGIALKPSVICGVITDFYGKVLVKEEVFFYDKRNRDDYLHKLCQLIEHLRNKAGSKLRGSALSVFGSYAGADYAIKNAGNFPSLNGLSLSGFCEKNGLQPIISDQLNSRLFYMLRCGNEKYRQDRVMLIAAGSGLGIAMAENGKMAMTRNNHGGELGHVLYDPNGKRCGCGRYGCLETVVSETAIAANASRIKGKETDFDTVCNMASAGDKEILTMIEKCGSILGEAIADQVNILFPDHLIITGTLGRLGKSFANAVEKAIKKRLFPLSASPLCIDFVFFDTVLAVNEIDAVGAALQAEAAIFADFETFSAACPIMEK